MHDATGVSPHEFVFSCRPNIGISSSPDPTEQTKAAAASGVPSFAQGDKVAFWVKGAEVPCGFAVVVSPDVTQLGVSAPQSVRDFLPGQYVQVHNLTLAERPNRKRVAAKKDPRLGYSMPLEDLHIVDSEGKSVQTFEEAAKSKHPVFIWHEYLYAISDTEEEA